MNDDDIRRLLRQLDVDVELRPDRAAEARAAMLAELDRSTGIESLTARATPLPRRNRWISPFAAAAAVAALLIGMLVLVRGESAPITTDTVPAVEVETYLRSCVDFQNATELDGADWFDVLAALEREELDDPGYRIVLADALDELSRAPRATSFSVELREAAQGLRSGDDLAGLIDDLRAIESASAAAVGPRCLR